MAGSNNYKRDERESPRGSLGQAFRKASRNANISPDDVALVATGQLHLVSGDRESSQPPGQPWRTVKMSTSRSDILAYRYPPLSVAQNRGAFHREEAASADSASASDFGKLFSPPAFQLGLSECECGKAGPSSKLRKFSENGSSMEQITHLAQAGTKLNLYEISKVACAPQLPV